MSSVPPDELRDLSQQAIDATATAYTEDASVDVAARLREEAADRGLELDDDAWVEQVARAIRSGHGVRVDPSAPSAPSAADTLDQPGSLGGDNGGG